MRYKSIEILSHLNGQIKGGRSSRGHMGADLSNDRVGLWHKTRFVCDMWLNASAFSYALKRSEEIKKLEVHRARDTGPEKAGSPALGCIIRLYSCFSASFFLSRQSCPDRYDYVVILIVSLCNQFKYCRLIYLSEKSMEELSQTIHAI